MITAVGLARIQRRETLQCTHAVALQNEIELALVVRKSRPLAFRMPQVQHAGCKAPVLAPHAAADEPNEEIGILQPPAGEGRIEAIDPFEIISKASHIAAAGTLPAPPAELAQGTKRKRDAGDRPD